MRATALPGRIEGPGVFLGIGIPESTFPMPLKPGMRAQEERQLHIPDTLRCRMMGLEGPVRTFFAEHSKKMSALYLRLKRAKTSGDPVMEAAA